MKLSACIDIMMRDASLLQKLQTVREAGLTAFEFWGWENKEMPELTAAMEETKLHAATFCTRMISLVDPECRAEYVKGLEATIPVAKALGCDRLITQTGAERPGVSRLEQRQSLVQGLQAAVPLLEAQGITLLVEPLNLLVDHAGYYLSQSGEAFAIIQEVDSPNVKVLYDIYHQQITEGNLIPTIETNVESIGHFHVADHPGRHEPGTGEINYRNVLRAIEKSGYQGYVGLEFKPTTAAGEALQAVQRLVDQL